MIVERFEKYGRIFLWAQDRADDSVVAHAYEVFKEEGKPEDYKPMCARGYNRAEGYGYSIFRCNVSNRTCEICKRRIENNYAAVEPKTRKTKFL